MFGLTMVLFFPGTALSGPGSARLLPVAVALVLTLLTATLHYRFLEKSIVSFGHGSHY